MAFQNKSLNAEINHELARRSKSAGWSQIALVALFLAFSYFSSHKIKFSIGAISLVVTMCVLRLLLASQHLKNSGNNMRKNFFIYFNIVVTLGGFAWGLLLMGIYKSHGLGSPEALMGSIILAGVLAGSTNSLMPRVESFLLFAIPALSFSILKIVISDTSSLENLVAGTFLIYLFFLLGIVKNARHDFLERIDALQKLKSSTGKLYKILDGFPGLVSHLNDRLEYLFINQFFESEMDLQKNRVIGKSVGVLEKSGDFERILVWFHQQDEVKIYSSEIQVPTKRGPETFLCTLSKIGEGEIVAASINVDELRKTQSRAEASAKLALLGEMAAGIGHEINNPLAIINGQMQLLNRKSKTTGVLTLEDFELSSKKVMHQVDRIGKIVRGLRALSRDEKLTDVSEVNLREIIEDTLTLVEERFKLANVMLEIDAAPEVKAQCNVVQISQVLLNLFSNACQAVQFTKNPWVKMSFVVEPSLLKILITDSGKGISKDIQDKIFQPFFTTKEVGKGTGLGLSLSVNILHNHGGSLKLNSENANTQFVITLPCEEITVKKAA